MSRLVDSLLVDRFLEGREVLGVFGYVVEVGGQSFSISKVNKSRVGGDYLFFDNFYSLEEVVVGMRVICHFEERLSKALVK